MALNGLITFSDNSVAERISREFAVEIIAAKTPVILNIQDDKAEIESAEHIWGMDTFATEEYVKKEANDSKVRILSIGPAGEKLVRFSRRTI